MEITTWVKNAPLIHGETRRRIGMTYPVIRFGNASAIGQGVLSDNTRYGLPEGSCTPPIPRIADSRGVNRFSRGSPNVHAQFERTGMHAVLGKDLPQ